MEKLDPEFKAKWIAALRSGEYKQGKFYLEHNGGYCCLGVACKIAGAEAKSGTSYIHCDVHEVPVLLRSCNSLTIRLANMNDGKGPNGEVTPRKSFPEIADWIQENL